MLQREAETMEPRPDRRRSQQSHAAPGISPIPLLLEDLRAGLPVIIVDDEQRENEGDLIIAAQHVDAQKLAFIIRHSGGVVCLALTNAHADRLALPPMVEHNTSRRSTAFTVSIEAKEGVTTGISAADRATTIRVASRPDAVAGDLAHPGHVFPLRAAEGGVLKRAGHTEAGVDLTRLAGLEPAAALSELIHDDGTMMRLPAMIDFAAAHGLRIGTIADLIAYRLEHDSFMRHVTSARLPTPWAEFTVHGYENVLDGSEHVALTLGDVADGRPVLVRLHSECLTGDVLHSLRCDCGAQRDAALLAIAESGRGALVYLRQEGRGIGLLNKIRAYHLQDQGADTVEANELLGFPADLRDHGIGAQVLADLGIGAVRLMTNNPRKVAALEAFGLDVVERVPLHVGRNRSNAGYLQAKVAKLGHWAE